MAQRSNYDIPVMLMRGGIVSPEKMTLAEAVREIMEVPLCDRPVDVRIIFGDMVIEGVDRIGAIYELPGFPKNADGDS
ncbi:MAG: hypothetical protein VW644_08265 [Alphaproteobacteria bacterium]|jgi:hypothetical protein